MHQLVIRLFGTFEAEIDHTPVDFAYDKAKAILAYLAVHLGRPVRREKLAGLLWSDKPQEVAAENLRQALSRLRKSLAGKDTLTPFLMVDRDKVMLNPATNIQVDVVLFIDAVSFYHRHNHRHSQTCRICATHMQTACQVFRGDFLEDLSLAESDLFEEWVIAQREQLHEQALDTLGWLTTYHQLAGDHISALTYARRLVELEPLNEGGIMQLVKIMVDMGKIDQAITHYRRFCRKLTDEIGNAPSKALTDYIKRVQSGEWKLDSDRSNPSADLPAPLSPLIGRQVELNELEVWLADPSRRLISLLGPGGIGKTRLAIAAAHQHATIFADGVMFISLSEVSNAHDLMRKIMGNTGLASANEQEMKHQLLEFLKGKDVLLVLDGFERVTDGKGIINWLLESEPGLVIMVTSRERLNVPGEWVFPMGGLPYPPSELTDDINQYSAVELFVFMARQLDPQFSLNPENSASIIRICRLVDGIPLAISLASAWARTLPCSDIARELQSGLDLLSTSGPSHNGQHISMRAALDQSWNRLSAEEQTVFRHISIFRGGFDRQAAEEITGASLSVLASLVDKSFMRCSPEGRYELHDLLLQYGSEKLAEAGETNQARQRHFDYFLRLAEKHEDDLRNGNNPFQAFFWIVKEQGNLHAAYEWSAEGDPPRYAEGARRLSACMHEELHKMGVHMPERVWMSLSKKH
jgi:predicted ATPase/DNA-binding SARP family transcriptional activator